MPDLKGDESADTEAKTKYQKILEQIEENEKKLFNIKLYKFLTTDWAEYLLNKLALYYYEKEKSKNKDVPEFTGDKENPIEVWEYNSQNGVTPIETIDNEDGSFTHKYADGSKVTIRTTLTGIIDEEIIIRSKTDTKKFYHIIQMNLKMN